MKLLMLPTVLLCLVSLAWAETLTLQDCLQLARQNNPELKSAVLSPDIAEKQIAEARGGYLPQVDADAGYTVLKDAQAVVLSGNTAPTQEDNFPFAGISVKQTLYDFGHTESGVVRAQALAQAARADFSDRLQDVLLGTVSAYFRLLKDEQLLAAAREEEIAVADHLRIAHEFFDQGVVTRNDVLQAEVELAGSSQRRLSRENAIENDWLQLNYLVGRGPGARGELQAETSLAVFAVDQLELEEILAEHPRVQAGRQRLAAGQADVAGSESAYRPTLFAAGSVEYLDNRYVREQTMYSATVGMKVNLFDGHAKRARLAAAQAREEQDRQLLGALEKQTALAYSQASNDSRVAEARIDVTRESIRQAEENLRINRDRYMSQVGTATDVLDAQMLLTRSRAEYYQAQYDHQVALARMQWALGRLGENHE